MNNLVNLIKNNPKVSITLKVLVIGILILILLIPLALIQGLIDEREKTSKEAVDEITKTWGGQQTVGSPVLAIPYGKGNNHYAYFLPGKLNIQANIIPVIRQRSIYQALLYKAELKISGEFSKPDFSTMNIDINTINWSKAFLTLEQPGLKSITKKSALTWNDKEYTLKPGLSGNVLYTQFVNFDRTQKSHSFSLEIVLNGGQLLTFLPMGAQTDVKVSSSWISPSFQGKYLPQHESLTDKGFEAEWSINSQGQLFPLQWSSTESFWHQISANGFGLELVFPVDNYQISTRSIKYSILFILFPFIAFFVFEIFSRKKIHILQYLLIGLAVCVFYLLLLALSEHIYFDLSYLIAALATSGLITFYASAFLSHWQQTVGTNTLLIMLYTFLYCVLKSPDYALLLGSIGLFIILAGFMILTRKVDWYKLEHRVKPLPEKKNA